MDASEFTEQDHDAQDRAIDVWEAEWFANGGKSGGWAESLKLETAAILTKKSVDIQVDRR